LFVKKTTKKEEKDVKIKSKKSDKKN
jgi:hypothetical protein